MARSLHGQARREHAYWLRTKQKLLFREIGVRLGVSTGRAGDLVYMGEHQYFSYFNCIVDASVEHAWHLRAEGLTLTEIANRLPPPFIHGEDPWSDETLAWLNRCILDFGRYNIRIVHAKIVVGAPR